jgi:diadenosine tetraphosphate (Ap4A) HIT family hydrolase
MSVCFYNWNNMNSTMKKSCAFCGIDQIKVLEENELAFATRDGFPVVPLHSLVVPKRHVPDYFSVTEAEQLACMELLLTHVASAFDGSGRLFVVEQAGRIRIIKNGVLQGLP